LPVSSTHCLFGGLIGAGLVVGASAHPSVIFYSAVIPLLMTPLLAFLLAFITMEFANGLVGRTAVKPLLRSSRIVMSVLT
ncbi:inorganic phosphate transporter, partial [Bacillus thuringiensis]|nr:inorganic phosphate transporter [Bacillus thuringiensis]